MDTPRRDDAGEAAPANTDKESLSSDNLIELWKTWNRMVWLTPVAFLATLSALGAAIAYILDAGQLPMDSGLLVAFCLIYSGGALGVSVLVLSRFLLRRDTVGGAFLDPHNVFKPGGRRAVWWVQRLITVTAGILVLAGILLGVDQFGSGDPPPPAVVVPVGSVSDLAADSAIAPPPVADTVSQ